MMCIKKFFFFLYQSLVSIQGPVGYGPTTLPLRHSDLLKQKSYTHYMISTDFVNSSFNNVLSACYLLPH
ncbi:unnamed protein product [Linum tenue]|uniref:Secreted protein n=1 Tax=Linum tenue TaxID=586396 RepID=A0AAV0IIT6_9ROSI|nr:unnamed protein product [Linum tenue]